MLLNLSTKPRLIAKARPAGLKSACLLALLLCGCPEPTPPGDDGGSCSLEFLGDPTQDIALEPLQLDAAGDLTPLSEGGTVDLILPPQGGRVIFVGARATNIDPCEVQVKGVIRDLDSGQVRFDTRIVNLTVDGDFGTSNALDIASLSNVPLCPNQWSARDAFGVPYELSIELTDRAGRSAETIVQVTPTCAEPEFEAQCLCICKQGYILGETCE